MKLNLQILKEDLKDLNVKGHFTDDRLVRRLAYPTIYNNERTPDGNKVYISKASDMPDFIEFTEVPSFICIGMPSDFYLKSSCNILYTFEEIHIYDLLNHVLNIYEYYYQWELKMQEIINENLPINALAKVTEPILKKPFNLHQANFKSLFFISNSRYYDIPENYPKGQDDNTYLSIKEINLLKTDPEFNAAKNSIEPTIFSANLLFFRSLYYNIRINGKYVARLLIDEIGSEFTDRDFALIKYFGEIIKISMKQKDIDNLNHQKGFEELLKKLLDHKVIPEEKIHSVLKENQWAVEDKYFCIYVEPTNYDKQNHVLSALEVYLSSQVPNNCSTIYKDNLIFVFNLSRSNINKNAVLSFIVPQLKDCLLKAGISAIFTDFKNLYYYYKQAENALSIGKEQDVSLQYYHFEDYLIQYYIKKTKDEMIPEALCPEGLMRLIEYDKRKNTDYTYLLRVYLENNMNISATIRQMYIHRNTFLYRLDKLNAILDMDLHDSNIRFILLMGFKSLINSLDNK